MLGAAHPPLRSVPAHDRHLHLLRPLAADQAHRVAEALRALGYGVWRDDELTAHRAYAEVIEERLKAAKAVVVIWSAEAAKSEWVRSEAIVHSPPGIAVFLDGIALISGNSPAADSVTAGS